MNYTEEEKAQLKKWSNGAKVEKRLHTRAQIILCCLENKRNIEIATELNVSLSIKDMRGVVQSLQVIEILMNGPAYLLTHCLERQP